MCFNYGEWIKRVQEIERGQKICTIIQARNEYSLVYVGPRIDREKENNWGVY